MEACASPATVASIKLHFLPNIDGHTKYCIQSFKKNSGAKHTSIAHSSLFRFFILLP